MVGGGQSPGGTTISPATGGTRSAGGDDAMQAGGSLGDGGTSTTGGTQVTQHATGGSVVSSAGAAGTTTSTQGSSTGGTGLVAGGSSLPALGGSSGTGGAEGGGTAGVAGSTQASQSCNRRDLTTCAPDEVCSYVVTDTCVLEKNNGCAGFCTKTQKALPCDGTTGEKCPDGFECLLEPGHPLQNSCVSTGLPSCASDVACPADFDCAAGRCVPKALTCDYAHRCTSEASICPVGYFEYKLSSCPGVCVSHDHCACTSDWECELTCDPTSGHCVTPMAPEPRCQLPPPPNNCGTPISRWVFVDGGCAKRDVGSCDTNNNQYDSVEECMQRCQGSPLPNPCPLGREIHTICLQCGAAGGCIKTTTVCAKPCQTNKDCESDIPMCHQGVCQMYGCI